MKARTIRHFIYLIILIAFDQFTKHLAVVNLKGQEAIKLIPGVFHLQYLENDGAVFGIFGGQAMALAIVVVIITAALIYVYFVIPTQIRYNPIRILIIFIIAGAIGNLIDRVRLNYVIDFLYFSLINFPIFNVADSYVTVATGIFMILSIFYYKNEDFEFLEKKENK